MSPKRAAVLRRAEIVRATIRCLARDGYSGLTMKKVAREAKVSQGILHYYFADKRAILAAALETVTADLDGNDLDDLVIDFGAQYGVWLWMNHTGL